MGCVARPPPPFSVFEQILGRKSVTELSDWPPRGTAPLQQRAAHPQALHGELVLSRLQRMASHQTQPAHHATAERGAVIIEFAEHVSMQSAAAQSREDTALRRCYTSRVPHRRPRARHRGSCEGIRSSPASGPSCSSICFSICAVGIKSALSRTRSKICIISAGKNDES